MKVHYDPFITVYNIDDVEGSEKGYCGIYLSEYDNNSTNDKSKVSCKKCIALFDQADKEKEAALNSELDFMQGFVDFMESEKVVEK